MGTAHMETVSLLLLLTVLSAAVLQVFSSTNDVDLNNMLGDVVKAVSEDKSTDNGNAHEKQFNLDAKRNQRSIYGIGPRMLQISRSKIPIELDLWVENNENDRLKRFDDYGHMRFGKRGGDEQFDDYGHMRFGRNT